MSILACIYLSAGLSVHAQSPTPPKQYNHWRWDITETHNPYGIVRAGCEKQLTSKLTLDVGLRHESSIPKNDFGVDSAFVELKWKPFR